MTMNLSLNEDERDCLQELMNISYGEATATIAKVINQYATLDIPRIKTLSSEEFKEYFLEKFDNKNIYYVSNQPIDGNLCGENMFIMEKNSVVNLAKEFGLSDDEINEFELKDILLEITNMLTSTTISKLASLIGATITFSPPSSKVIQDVDNLDNRYESAYSQTIIISTRLSFKEQDIEGELLIMSKDDSFLYLKEALNKILEDF